MYYVYLLRSHKDTNLYVGYTKDLRRRLSEHNNGEVFSTKGRLPLELIYYESYKIMKDAKKREYMLKKDGRALAQLKRRIYESLL